MMKPLIVLVLITMSTVQDLEVCAQAGINLDNLAMSCDILKHVNNSYIKYQNFIDDEHNLITLAKITCHDHELKSINLACL